MRRVDARLAVGVLLIAAGLIYLLQNLGYITWGSLVWAAGFAVGGLVFLGWYLRDRAAWWAIIPGLTLLGLGGIIALDLLSPGNNWTGSLFLGSIGLAFWLIYLRDRGMWWAIIPGGTLLTLAAVAGLDNLALPFEGGGVFFIGLGVTFLLVALAPTTGTNLRWAYFPAAALLVMGLLIGVGFERSLNYLWPAALILGGLALLLRSMRRPA
jgi:hypothetical protein